MLRIGAMTGSEQCRGAHELALLVAVNREAGLGKLRRAPAAYFDERQAVPVEQDQVDLAAASTKISGDRPKSALGEIAKSELLGVIA